MTQEQHPITPPDELVEKWTQTDEDERFEHFYKRICTQAARWGADRELEACCNWILNCEESFDDLDLLNARRPKPPSLKERASQIVDCLIECDCLNDDDAITLRQVVESLPS